MDYNDADSGRGEDKKLDKKVKWALAAASVCESAKGKRGEGREGAKVEDL